MARSTSDSSRNGVHAAFDRPLGVQVYAIRSVLPANGEAVLLAIAAIGYKEVEIGNFD